MREAESIKLYLYKVFLIDQKKGINDENIETHVFIDEVNSNYTL